MRVIAGSARGLILSAPKHGGVRPTPNRVKKSIFDILGQRVIQARVIDLFAGSGSLGIEALSRGALECCFVDNSYHCCRIINQNLIKAGFMEQARVLKSDARRKIYELADQGIAADLIFLDPPYSSKFILPAIDAITDANILADEGIVIIEHPAKYIPVAEGYRQLVQKQYGDSGVTLLLKRTDKG